MNKKSGKQLTFENLLTLPKQELTQANTQSQQKEITITEINTATKEDELALKVGFRLSPSKAYFSKVWFELFFEGQKLNNVCVFIPQGPLATDEFELTPVLDMNGIAAGSYTVKVEMFEQWATGEKFTNTSKETKLEYVPVNRQDRLIKVPTVKSVAGTDLSVISSKEKDIYKDLKQDMKKEQDSKRDQW